MIEARISRWCARGVALALLACLASCGRVEGQSPDAVAVGTGADAADDGGIATRGPATKGPDGGAAETARDAYADAGVAAACVPGDRKCDGTTPLSCDERGAWQTGAPCVAACRGGACTDGCTPGARSCDRDLPRLCSDDGNWQLGAECPFVCRDGSCAGTCAPGTVDCDDNGSPRTCNNGGDWVTADACPFLCKAGLCVGSCKPGALRCKGVVPQKCDDTGAWQDGAACPAVCSAGQCTDGCTPGTFQCSDNVPQSCDQSGRWQNGATCPFVCMAGVCGGVCVPGDERCAQGALQSCDASGAWQTTGAASREMLVNPAFDDGPSSGWTQVGSIIYRESGMLDTAADTPPFLAWLGGYNKADDDLYQTVTVPASTVSLELSFRYKVFTQERKTGAAFDFMRVELHTSDGQVMALGQLSNNDAVSTWADFGAMLPPALAGKTMELHFHATTDLTFLTSFYVDTVSLQAVGCP